MPAEVLVGAKVFVNIFCQAPGVPAEANPVAAMVMDPAPFVMVILEPSDKVESEGTPEPSPIKSCPLVMTAEAVRGDVPPPKSTPPEVKEVAPVPP